MKECVGFMALVITDASILILAPLEIEGAVLLLVLGAVSAWFAARAFAVS